MPANKNALLRYKTIDNCLRNTGRQWTLDELGYNAPIVVFGRNTRDNFIVNPALDRVTSIEAAAGEPFIEDPGFNPQTYFKNIIGVTKSLAEAIRRRLKAALEQYKD